MFGNGNSYDNETAAVFSKESHFSQVNFLRILVWPGESESENCQETETKEIFSLFPKMKTWERRHWSKVGIKMSCRFARLRAPGASNGRAGC